MCRPPFASLHEQSAASVARDTGARSATQSAVSDSSRSRRKVIRGALGLLCLVATSGGLGGARPLWADTAPAAEGLLGDRLSVETRFSQYFYAHAAGQVNVSLATGDPVVSTVETTHGPVPGPFAGQAMNCRSCHLIDEVAGTAGQRTYADFARRSPIPAREDGATMTTRNSPPLVNAFTPRRVGFFLHFDGEFPTPEALVKATLTGRNYGWLPDERALAVAHIANVIRNDDGSAETATFFGNGAYRDVLSGAAVIEPADRPIPSAFQIDVMHASDEEVLDAVARLVSAYMRSLVFTQDAAGSYTRSAFDVFLAKNGLPTQPRPNESGLRYSRRLRKLLGRLTAPQFVSEADGHLQLHDHPFRFGPDELTGLRIFLTEARHRASVRQLQQGGVGNCIACHPAPDFTDFSFHNTGATQEEYDALHGQGAFAALSVPSLPVRNADPDRFLPPSAAYPHAQSPFRAVASAEQPGVTDLGLWNIYQNPAFPDPDHQQALQKMICRSLRSCGGRRPDRLLDAALGLFKTSGLRDLGHSDPYLHTGRMDSLEDVVDFYRTTATAQRAGLVRNGAHELAGIALGPDDVAPLAAFLRALDEDYR